MHNWLVAHDVPTSAILLDHDGYNSWKTALATKHHLDRTGGQSCIVVSQYWHITRCKIALKAAGISSVYSAHARYFGLRDLYSIPREIPAVWDYLLK